ncbi:MAG: adenosylhomocysteinase, partial [Methylobacter sp.]
KGHGAQVVVTEVDPLKALEAAMDGFRIMPMLDAAACSDFIVTVTGNKHVLDHAHFEVMKDGCIIANAGHFNVEINIPALADLAVKKHRPRANVEAYQLTDGRIIRLLAEGRLVNLAAAEGHPATVMDMSFANQALSIAYLWEQGAGLENRVHPVPAYIDQQVAVMKLAAMGLSIDDLSPEQQAYLSSWKEGT